MMPTDNDMYAEARRIAEDAAVRELERSMAWAEHVAAALALVAPKEEP